MIGYTRDLYNVIDTAKRYASCYGGLLGTEHILQAMLTQNGSYAYEILSRLGLKKETLFTVPINASYNIDNVSYTRLSKRAVARTKSIVDKFDYQYADTQHLLLAIAREENGGASRLLQEAHISAEDIEAIVTSMAACGVGKNKSDNDKDNNIEETKAKENVQNAYAQKEDVQLRSGADCASGGYLTDMTAIASKKKYDPLIGREKELSRLVQILVRRTKNNPVLIGEHGVGKTAVVEGLACAIVNNAVPTQLKGKRLYSLNIAEVMAGAKYRGDLEERLTEALKAVKEANALLFIDEIHTVVNAGGNADSGGMTVANLLKPMLAKGELPVIGATTQDEYRLIQKDGALCRRFQPVTVPEPDADTALKILSGLRKGYEKHHGVDIDDSALCAAVEMSIKYITDRQLPDKAIDLIDEACAAKRISGKNMRVDVSDVAAVVAEWTGIPTEKINGEQRTKLLRLEAELKKRIIGQDAAVEAVVGAVKRNRAGLKESSRPIGSFLFVGSTGVGKTELAKALAETLFDSGDSLVKLDMSEYADKASIARLIGAAPGYVGYADGGQLTEAVRRKPYAVVLFDELEKASSEVHNILLQILEDGCLTDGSGKRVSFKNTLIIMTSNVGYTTAKTAVVGFAGGSDSGKNDEDSARSALKQQFKAEFLNRIDEVIFFKSITTDALRRILELQLESLAQRLSAKSIGISVSEAAKAWLTSDIEANYGARPLRRAVRKSVEDVIGDMLIRGELKEGETVNIDCHNKEIFFTK